MAVMLLWMEGCDKVAYLCSLLPTCSYSSNRLSAPGLAPVSPISPGSLWRGDIPFCFQALGQEMRGSIFRDHRRWSSWWPRDGDGHVMVMSTRADVRVLGAPCQHQALAPRDRGPGAARLPRLGWRRFSSTRFLYSMSWDTLLPATKPHCPSFSFSKSQNLLSLRLHSSAWKFFEWLAPHSVGFNPLLRQASPDASK